MEKRELKVQGMTCQHCVNTVRRALSSIEGVVSVNVDLPTGRVEVELEKDVPQEKLTAAIEEWGYKVVEG